MYIRKDIFKVAFPVFIEQLFMTSIGMINTLMASNLNGQIGLEVFAAISMVSSIDNMFNSLFMAMSTGGAVVVAQYIGAKDIKSANETAKQAVSISIIITTCIALLLYIFATPLLKVLFGSVTYNILQNGITYFKIVSLTYPLLALILMCNGMLRGSGDTKTSAKVTILMNVVNIILSYSLLYGVNIGSGKFGIHINPMGIKGAAYAVVVTRIVGFLFVASVLFRGKRIIKIRSINLIKINKMLIKQISHVGVPASVQALIFQLGKVITQTFIASMGTIAMVSNSISNSIFDIVNIPGYSLIRSSAAIVGQAAGSGDLHVDGTSNKSGN